MQATTTWDGHHITQPFLLCTTGASRLGEGAAARCTANALWKHCNLQSLAALPVMQTSKTSFQLVCTSIGDVLVEQQHQPCS